MNGISMKTEEKQRLTIGNRFLSPEGSQSRFLDVGLKDGSGNLMNFLVCSLNVSGDGTWCSCELFE